MIIPFTKMHGIGNDFILMNGKDLNKWVEIPDLAARVCHRHYGIGADGLMILRESQIGDARMEYYNSDGSVGEMCGNGIRCFARYFDNKRSSEVKELSIETMAGIKKLTIKNIDSRQSIVSVDMGIPMFHEFDRTIIVEGREYVYSYVTMGVPHVVIFTDEVDEAITDTVGPLLEKHKRFESGTNVNFCHIRSNDNMNVFTWERGAGHTLACGTGITSAYAVAVKTGKLNSRAVVQAEGGTLELEAMDLGSITMTGPAMDVCEGHYFYS